MRLVALELKRIFSDMLLWALIAACLVINGILVCSGRTSSARYRALDELCGPITEASVSELEDACRELLQTAQERYLRLYGAETEALDDLYARGCLSEDELYRMELLYQLSSYGKAALGGSYSFPLDEFAASRGEYFTSQVEKASQRQTELRKDGEAEWFTAARFTESREVLYGKLLPALFIEAAALAVYIVLRAMESERVFGTAAILYSTRVGRSVRILRLIPVLLAVTGIFASLSAAALGANFALYPQSSSLAFPAAASVYPTALPKTYMTGLGHLLASLSVGYALLLVFVLLAAAVGTALPNSYFGLLAAGSATGIMALAQRSCTEKISIANLLLSGNPVGLLLKYHEGRFLFRTGDLFSYTADCRSVPFFELIVPAVWLLAGGVLLFLSWRYFCKKEL